MKGFVKVSHVVITTHKNETDCTIRYISKEKDFFIPKKQITSVRFFNSENDIYDFYLQNYDFETEPKIQSNYMIKVRNKSKYSVYKFGTDNSKYIPKIITYFVDPSENEHMERFIAGTDDALYDYVELLKYLPKTEGYEVKQAEERTSKKIKLKSNDQ